MTSDFLVLAAAAALIALVNWYFLFSRQKAVSAAAAAAQDGVQAIDVRVHGGYSPSLIEVQRGRPVRITFDRQEDNPCSEELVVPSFGIRQFLPAFARTAVEFTPQAAGDIEFTCGMGMLHGTVRVR